MKKYFLAFVVFMLAAAGMSAQQTPAQYPSNYPYTFATFAPITVAGATPYLDLSYSVTQTHKVTVVPGTGTLTACTFTLQDSADKVTWLDITTSSSCLVPIEVHVSGIPARYVRVNVATYVGTAPVTFYYTGLR
jgi:hypothetical protein